MAETKMIAVDSPYGWHYRVIDKKGRYLEGWLRNGEFDRSKVTAHLLEKYGRVLEVESDWISPAFAKGRGKDMTRCTFTEGEFVEDADGNVYVWKE